MLLCVHMWVGLPPPVGLFVKASKILPFVCSNAMQRLRTFDFARGPLSLVT